MSTGPAGGGYHTSEDEKLLHKLGYAQELFRAMGGFRNFAISFTIISILAGCLTSYYIGFEHGGPMWVTWGWLLVGLMATIIALAMAEIASAYPTAGGLYYWASKLGGPGWGWATGWFNLIGQVAVTAAIGYGLALFGQALFDYWFSYSAHMNDWFGATFDASTYILYAIFLTAAVLINMFDVRITSGLNMISAWWHMVGVVVIVAILIIVPDRHQSVSYVFTQTVNNSGFGDGTTNSVSRSSSCSGSACSCRSTRSRASTRRRTRPRRHTTPRVSQQSGCDLSVVVSVIFGWILLLGVTFAIPSTQGALDTVNDLGLLVPWIWTKSMSQNWAEVAALHLRRRAVLLPDGFGHVGVADDVRVLTRRRSSGAPAVAKVARNRVPRYVVLGDRGSSPVS